MRPILIWLLLLIFGVVGIGLQDYASQRDRFVQDTSIVHRMLSQKAVQHEAVLATLAALSHPPAPERLFPSLQPALPQLEAIGLDDGTWHGSSPSPMGMSDALAQARQVNRPVVLPATAAASYWLVDPSGWSILLNAQKWLAREDIPHTLNAVELSLPAGQLHLLGSALPQNPTGLVLHRSKPLGAASQPFTLRTVQVLTPVSWPWTAWLTWALASAALVAGWTLWQRARAYALREREQSRLAAIGRLNTLGEMAAGIAHELNQPLTAILAQTGAAQRLLDDPDEQPQVRRALQATAGQARRAAEILERLRALMAHGEPAQRSVLNPDELIASLRFLRESELARAGIRISWTNDAPDVRALGDRVALEQILHNLVQNAADALASQTGPRLLDIRGRVRESRYEFIVRDNGPGIPADKLPRIFEPFYTTRAQGMGLGLTLCETLAGTMDAHLHLENHAAGGVCATLALPLYSERQSEDTPASPQKHEAHG
ncbi:histidine kinase [Bordetella tumbae]